ncbi:MAG: hypothetical protein D6742_20400 [Cyanobacteria bacterium J069]|nr:MAG: hypothetical protein D6742_20400 [Cyanobacteria bacterium J069]
MRHVSSLSFLKYFCCGLLLIRPALAQPSLSWVPLNEPGTGGRIDSITVNPHNSNHVLVGGDILGARVSTDQGGNWAITSGWLNYEISDFTWHPRDSSTVWAGSLSGPHLSTDGGKTWIVKRAGFPPIDSGKYTAPVEKVLFDPDSDRLLAFGGDHRQLRPDQDVLNYGAVWVSQDGGNRWSLLSRIVDGGNIMAASYAGASDTELYAAVWGHGVFYSRDDGATWSKRNTGLSVNQEGQILAASLAVHPQDSKIAWVTVDKAGIYKTVDGGANWRLLSRGVPTQEASFWSITISKDGQILYAGNRNYEHRPGVYKSIDGGNSWSNKFFSTNQIDVRQKPYPGGINPWWVAVDPTYSGTVYAGTDNAVYRSVDGGQVWSVLTAERTPQGWRGNGFSGLVSRNIAWNPENPNHVIVQGMDEARAIQSWDGGRHWRIDNPGLPPYSGGHDVAFASGWIFAVFGQDGDTEELVARSHDSGRTWTLLRPPVSPSEATQVHVDPRNPNRLWIVVNRQLWYSDNATRKMSPRWTRLTVGSEDNAVGDIEAIPGQGEAFYIATDNGIYHTTDGQTFRSIGGPKSAENVEMAIAPSKSDILYAVRDKSYWEDYGVWRYDASADHWTRVWGDRNVTSWIGDIAIHPTNSDVLAIITNDFPYHDQTFATGVWLSQDGGQTWQPQNQGLPMLRGDVIAFHPNGHSLVVGLGGAGFYTANFYQRQRSSEGLLGVFTAFLIWFWNPRRHGLYPRTI